MITILFICTGNTCRSPMARALLLQRWRAGAQGPDNGEIQVWSAGLSTQDDLPASPPAIKVMREEGLDISDHRSLLLKHSHIRDADLILTMTVWQRDYLLERYPDRSDKIYTLSEFTGDKSGDVLDPYGKGPEYYRKSFHQLKQLVDRLYNRIS